jgi:hypothetical protein
MTFLQLVLRLAVISYIIYNDFTILQIPFLGLCDIEFLSEHNGRGERGRRKLVLITEHMKTNKTILFTFG